MKEIVKRGPAQRRPFGAKRAHPATKKTPKYRPEDEATVEDVVAAQNKARTAADSKQAERRERQRPPVARLERGTLPVKIEVQSNPQMRTIVPGNVWRTRAFKWDPMTFGVESERLNEKVIDVDTQNRSLAMWLDDPSYPYVYGVTGSPDDADAKYFAAYLVQAHMSYMGHKANVVWHTLYGDFNNRILKEYDEIDGKSSPSLIILSNMTPNSTSVKLEKARDILERFADIPRIVVAAGEDPFSFVTMRLYSPIHALAYFSSTLVKKRMEII
jgi:hypothetical protein